jgi:hypothetical protein
MFKRVWILLEGGKDSRFFDGVLRPILETKYDLAQAWEYAQEPTKKTMDFIRSIRHMKSHFFFLGDINDAPCVTSKKDSIKKKYGESISPYSVVIVVKEIESWYLAGVDDGGCKEFGIPNLPHTNDITKEQFEELIPQRFVSVVDFMSEILKRFSIKTAKRKNKSFRYLMAKLQENLQRGLT